MKRYLSTTKKDSRLSLPGKKGSFKFVAIAFLVLTAGYVFPSTINSVSEVILWPAHSFVVWLDESPGSLPQFIRDRRELLQEIEQLQMELGSTVGANQNNRRLMEENASLRALLSSTPEERIMAEVIDRPPNLLYDNLQINKGYTDGMIVGAPVYTGQNAVVGVVVHTSANYSFVELLTSPGFISSAYVLGADVFAELEGVGGGVGRVRLPQGLKIEVGQLVLLPAVDSGIYGEIISIENPPTQPVQYGYVAPLTSLQSVRYVTVSKRVPQERTVPEINESVRELSRDLFTVEESIWFELDGFVATTTIATSTDL